MLELDGAEPDLSWLPDGEQEAPRARARAVWPVLAVGAAGSLHRARSTSTRRACAA